MTGNGISTDQSGSSGALCVIERVQADRITVCLIVPLYLIGTLEHYFGLTDSGQTESALGRTVTAVASSLSS